MKYIVNLSPSQYDLCLEKIIKCCTHYSTPLFMSALCLPSDILIYALLAKYSRRTAAFFFMVRDQRNNLFGDIIIHRDHKYTIKARNNHWLLNEKRWKWRLVAPSLPIGHVLG